MKITFVTASLNFSGGIYVAALHAAMLRDRGHDVKIISPPQRKVAWRTKWRAFKNGGISELIDTGPQTNIEDLGVDCRILDTYRPVISADVPDGDVVVATWWETAEWVSKLSPQKGAKVYFIQGHEIFSNLPIERAKATYRMPLHKIVVSKWLSKLMETEYGDDSSDLVANSVDLDVFRGGNRTKSSRPTIGFLYSQVQCKTVSIAIDSLIKAREINPELRVVCFGSKKPDSILPLPSWFEFQFKPPADEIPGIYRSCDAWLFSSQAEGFGLPIIEAMACGTPVIGTSAGAAPQYIDDQTGALVEANPEAFVEQILRFSQMSDEEWQQKSRNARQRVSDYTWQDASLLFEQALLRAIGKSKRKQNKLN